MGPYLIVVLAPLLDADLGVDAIPKPVQGLLRRKFCEMCSTFQVGRPGIEPGTP